MKGIQWIPVVVIALVVTAAASWAQTTTVPVPPVSVMALPTPVTVTLTENQISVNPTQAPAGAVDFIVTNSGSTPHALNVAGPGARMSLPTVLQPGQTATLHLVGLQAGSYTLTDPVNNNARRGMTATFVVTPPATRVLVSLTEYKVTPSQNMAAAGNVDFLVTNNGTMAHSLAIRGAGVNQVLPTPLQPGQSATLPVVNLQPGTYTLYCPVDNHAAMGMQATFTVTTADVTVNASLTEYRVTLSQVWGMSSSW
jgi:plastocyanin